MKINPTPEHTRVRTDVDDSQGTSGPTLPSWESPSLPTFRAVQYEGRYQIVHVPTGQGVSLETWTEPGIALRVARRFIRALPDKLRREIRKAEPKWSDDEKAKMRQHARAAIHWGLMLQYRYVDMLQAQAKAF